MSGVEVAREVREMGCPLYIVGCTGNALREDQVSRFLRFSSRSMLMGHAGRVHRSRSGRHHPQTRPPESRGRVHTRSETASRKRDGTEGSRAGVRGWITYDGDALNTVLKEFSHIWCWSIMVVYITYIHIFGFAFGHLVVCIFIWTYEIYKHFAQAVDQHVMSRLQNPCIHIQKVVA